MKKLFFILFLLAATISYANGPQKAYCELISHQLANGKMGFVRPDFGKEYKVKEIKDADGKSIKFKSIVDALNYFSELGWNLEFTYVVSASEVHCLLSIELKEGEDLYDLFKKKPIKGVEDD